MNPRLKKIALHTIILVAALAMLSLVAIWLGLGPVVHSWPISREAAPRTEEATPQTRGTASPGHLLTTPR